MPIVRLPENIVLKDGLLRGDNEAHVALWRRGTKEGEWERIRSMRAPEAVDVPPHITGVSVTISQWKEIVRGFFAKIFQKRDPLTLTDTIPLGGGKPVEVESLQQGLRHAFLAWGKEAGVKFDDALVAELFSGNEGHEILGRNNDLCLLYGKAEKIVPRPSVATTPQRAGVTIPPYQRFINEVEAKFAHRIKLADYPEGTHIPGLECLETEPAKRALAAFREAEKMRIIRTELYIPRSVNGLASLVLQEHPDGLGGFHENVFATQAALFRLLHILRHNQSERVLLEGSSYDSNIWEDRCAIFKERKFVIPGTNLLLASVEGQQYLFENPEILYNLLSISRRGSFGGILKSIGSFEFLLPEQFPFLQGAEHPNMKQDVMRFMDLRGEDNTIWGKYTFGAGFRVDSHPQLHDRVVINGQLFNKAIFLSDVRRMIQIKNEQTEIHTVREEFVTSKVLEASQGNIPHLIFGAGHKYAFLRRFAEHNLGVMVTIFNSMNISEECFVTTVGGASNPHSRMLQECIKYIEQA